MLRRLSFSGLLLLAPLALPACDGGDDADDGGAGDRSVTLQFVGVAGDQAVACGDTYALGAAGSSAELQDFRLYVHDVRLVAADGTEVEVTLDEDAWQHENVALLDFEDASGPCATNGTIETNMSVRGTVPEGDYTGVRFTVGVPEGLNHGDVASAPSPLNLASMGWTWLTGYKFVRIDTSVEGTPWFFHLGAGGCTNADMNPAAGPDDGCSLSNRPEIALSGFDVEADTIVVDLEGFFAGVDMTTDTEMSPPGCMANPADGAECEGIFANVGLDRASGSCDGDCAGQQAFRVQ